MHKEFLTSRYLFGLLDFLLCLLGFGLGIFYTCKGLCKLGLFRLKLMLHGLEPFAELLDLLLYLAHSGILLLELYAFQRHLVFGLGQCFLQRGHFGGGPC